MMESVLKDMNASNLQYYENLHAKYFNRAKIPAADDSVSESEEKHLLR
jgi:hypothetical protein